MIRYLSACVQIGLGVGVADNIESPWLVLGAAVTMLGWAYEAVRWRNTLAK
jgi:hypothetical protein